MAVPVVPADGAAGGAAVRCLALPPRRPRRGLGFRFEWVAREGQGEDEMKLGAGEGAGTGGRVVIGPCRRVFFLSMHTLRRTFVSLLSARAESNNVRSRLSRR